MAERELVSDRTNRGPRLCRLAQFAILLACGMACAGQSSEYLGRKIRSVEYVPADSLAPADLERVKVLKAGSILRREDVAEAIDRLFATLRRTRQQPVCGFNRLLILVGWPSISPFGTPGVLKPAPVT